jgi:hypothetical protein
LESALDFGLDARPTNIHNLATGMKYDLITIGQTTPVTANRFPQTPLDRVPDSRLSNGLGYG